MRVFLEKEFIEYFELEFLEKRYSGAYRRLYALFTEYPNIVCYINTDEDNLKTTILNSKILTKLTDINPRIYPCQDLRTTILGGESLQTLVFTEDKKDWFENINDETILMFSYDDFEDGLMRFIEKTHIKFDLSDQEMTFDWNYFGFISAQNNVLILTDPYVLIDKGDQKIKDNLLELLKQNLIKEKPYVIFIITDFNDCDIKNRYQFLNRNLGGYNVKVYLINRIKYIENFVLHDRLLYTNYTLTTSPAGFNIRTNKLVNSELATTSIFDKYTYKKYLNHMRGLTEYLKKLESFTDYNNTIKVEPGGAFDKFQGLVAKRCF